MSKQRNIDRSRKLVLQGLQEHPLLLLKDLVKMLGLTREYVWRLAAKDPEIGDAYGAALVAKLNEAKRIYEMAVTKKQSICTLNRLMLEIHKRRLYVAKWEARWKSKLKTD